MAAFAQMVTIGVVVKPQGRRGEVAVEPTTDDPARFPGLRRAWLPGPGSQARRREGNRSGTSVSGSTDTSPWRPWGLTTAPMVTMPA